MKIVRLAASIVLTRGGLMRIDAHWPFESDGP